MAFYPAGGTSGSGGGGQQVYQFRPETYGAQGNGKVIADVVTNSTAVITSVSASFSQADVGKAIMINGANGTAAAPFLGTILSVQTGTQATLSSATAATASGCPAVYGTDDTAAINSAISAARTYALANLFFAEVLFGSKIYMVAAAPTQTTTPAVQNAQIPLPLPGAVNGTGQKLVISLKGVGNAGQAQYFQSSTPNLQGTCIVSTQTAPSTVDPTFGFQSVIGGPSGSAGLGGSFSNVKPVIDGLTVWVPILGNLYGYDFGFVSGVEWGSFSAMAFAPPVAGTHPQLNDLPPLAAFQASHSLGCRFPVVGNNDDVSGVSYACEGFEVGLDIADHFACQRVMCVYVDAGCRINLTSGISGTSHMIFIGNYSVEAFNGALTCNGGGGTYAQVNITMDPESIGGAAPTYDISDAGAALHGIVQWGDPGRAAVGGNIAPTINGAANLKIVNNRLNPGSWAGAPAAPASGTAQQNTSWRDATVYVSSTVPITAVVVGGVTTGQTAAAGTVIPVWVPSGMSYTITAATGAQTTHWVLD